MIKVFKIVLNDNSAFRGTRPKNTAFSLLKVSRYIFFIFKHWSITGEILSFLYFCSSSIHCPPTSFYTRVVCLIVFSETFFFFFAT